MAEDALTIAGGTVLDGLGSRPLRADVTVRGGRIEAVGRGLDGSGRRLDARGMVVMPGVIDAHTHDDFTLPLRPAAEARVRQGITTTVTGNCGFSPFPLDESEEALRHGAFFEPGLGRRWADLAGYAEDLDGAGLAVNVAPLVGLGAVRLAVVGEEDRAATPEEAEEMRRLVAAALGQGAFGASSGLVYAPGCYADAVELKLVLADLAEARGFYATHMRDEARHLEDSVRESIAIGRGAGCATHISHHKAIGRDNWGRVADTLELIDAANAAGQDVSLDAYPYEAGSSTLLSLIPAEHQGGGVEGVRERLADPARRPEVVAAIAEQRVFALADVVLAAVPSRPALEGKRVPEAAAAAAVEPAELVARLVEENGVDAVMVGFGMDPADVRRVLTHPDAMVGSDAWVMEPGAAPHPHPRNFSTTARFLTEFVRGGGPLTLPEAVRKLTHLPARRLGLPDRGVIAEGAVADVVVLDPERLRDLATYERPDRYPEGFAHVLVSAVPVLEDGETTGARPGRVLARPGAGARA